MPSFPKFSSFPNCLYLLRSQASCLLFTPTDSCWAVLWRHLSLSLGNIIDKTPWSSLFHELIYDSCAVGGSGLLGEKGDFPLFLPFAYRNNSRNLLSLADFSSTQYWTLCKNYKIATTKNSRIILNMVTRTAI